MNCLYSNVIEAKDGTLIPVFTSGKTMYSKYSPCKETETFANNCKQEQLQFFLICGSEIKGRIYKLSRIKS